ncbi:MAG: putative acetyltransferase [Parcubacteria group bacterium Athens0714_26]|nr:MAG: putative acetyltransferase [Parcubacteria group bacterium Athens1014_26]TSD03036.1 MAG: putative acetyltransferase [Parcubacteria group bacterium Athens0714_26]
MTKIINKLKWDSDFFGFKIGSFSGLDYDNAEKFLKEFYDNKFDCVYVFVDPNDFNAIDIAAKNNFFLADIQMTYEFHSRPQKIKNAFLESLAYEILDVSSEDHKIKIRMLARELSSVSRFSFDPRFKNLSSKMYEIWADNIMRDKDGVTILAIDANKKIVGFIGSTLKQNIGNVGLVWVSEAFRGRGIGAEMSDQIVSLLFDKGAEKITVKTQLRNNFANRLYQKVGFRLKEAKLIYHFWR